MPLKWVIVFGELPRKVILDETNDPMRFWDAHGKKVYISEASAFDRELDALAAYYKLLHHEVEARREVINKLRTRTDELTETVNLAELQGMLLVHGYNVPLTYIDCNWDREEQLKVKRWVLMKDDTVSTPPQLQRFNKL